MKKIFFTFLMASALVACKNENSKQNPQQELETLKKQRTEITDKINALEDKLGAGKEQKSKLVSLYTVNATPFTSYLNIQGKVDGGENVTVSPMAQGTLTAVYVHLGQRVSKGQILAKIDDNVLRQSIVELKVQIDLAKNIFQRQKNLWDQKIGTEVQYLNAKANVDGLTSKLQSLQTQLGTYIVKAPIGGTVDQMDLRVGQAYAPGALGLRIVNDSQLSVKAVVSESYIGKINAGDVVKISFPELADTLRTKVSYATRSIDAVSRGFQIEIKLPSKAAYHPNMMANIQAVDYQKSDALVVPVNVIQKSETSDYVYISKNKTAKRVDVKVGKISNGLAEIIEGLQPGDEVINLGVQEVNEGDTLVVQ